MFYDGYLDGNDGWKVDGWALDSRRPNEPVEVEYEFSSGLAGSVIADQLRDDLLKHGLGNGRHAFSFPLPLDLRQRGEFHITARIKDTDFVLKGCPMQPRSRDIVALVAGDIVNNCNLRCPFCIVDYANIRGLKIMTADTFRRAIELLPQMAPGSFWMSCLHEPTLHPQFADLVEMVPDLYRNRISFTTNLCKRLPDDTLERLAHSGVDHIRVSFDSKVPALFAEFRKGGKYEIFEDNLARLGRFLRTSARRPRLHLISMAFKKNYRELPGLVHYGRDVVGADSHEIRYPYYAPHLAQWGREHVLDPEQWSELERSLAPLAALTKLEVFGPPEGTREQFELGPGVSDYTAPEAPFGGPDGAALRPPAEPAEIGRQMSDEPARLHLRWDGVIQMQQLPEQVFHVNISQLEKPSDYFEAVRIAAKLAPRPR